MRCCGCSPSAAAATTTAATSAAAAAAAVEGWIVVATNIHEEAQEEDIHEAFDAFGKP